MMMEAPESDRAPAAIARILEERARALARPLAVESRGETAELLVVTIGGEQYAVEITFVIAATWLRGLVPLTGTPAFVAGVVLHRGRILAVLDLRPLLSLPAAAIGDQARVVVIEARGMTFGIAVDDIVGVVEVPESEMAVGADPGGERAGFVRAVTRTATVLDAEALAADPRIRVEQDFA